VQGALGLTARIWSDREYLRTLFSFLERTEATGPRGTATEGPLPGDGIRFEDVGFSYPGAKSPTLEGVSLHLPARKKLALVGENGAGKTTLIKLLTGLYEPTRGRILLDGRPLQEWDEHTLRRRIGVIFQDFVQYQFTVGENVGVGDVEALEDEARWAKAAELGMATEVIEKLPAGFHTQLGKWFEDGRELSLGQWQKVALSRAFMRQSADILVLDEPTASMDAEAEARIFARFRMLTAGKSAILISHRFSTVRMADEIAVLAGGRVIEQGSHAELMTKNGRYAELFTMQAQGYR
jgi:ATP-binding cassette subfamily B protein